MKKFIFLSLLLLFATNLFAQDIIITKEDTRIEAKILTVYNAVISYKLFNDPDGATYYISKNNIKTITYQNGREEHFGAGNKVAAEQISHENEPQIINETPEKIRQNVIKANLGSTLLGAFMGVFELDLQYSRYVSKKVAIPIEIEIAGAQNVVGFSVLTGIEAVPLTHRQKSGLMLDALAGIMVLDGVAFIMHADIGYQLISKGGFVFNAAIGPGYDSYTNKAGIHFILSFGFAF
jgi:hypothetical protein